MDERDLTLHRRSMLAAVGAGTLLGATGIAAADQQDENGDDGAANGDDDDSDDAAGAGAEPAHYVAAMTGDQAGVETEARGTAALAADPNGHVHYALVVSAIENPTMTHIHLGPVGEDGPVVQWLHPTSEPDGTPMQITGRFDGVLHHGIFSENDFVGPLEGESLETMVQVIEDGEAYVNVHTEQNPGGEIRGQLQPFDAVVDALAPETDDAAAAGETPADDGMSDDDQETSSPDNESSGGSGSY